MILIQKIVLYIIEVVGGLKTAILGKEIFHISDGGVLSFIFQQLEWRLPCN